MHELRGFRGIGPMRRVPVCDLREVRPGAQRPPREQSAGACRVVLGPWRGSRLWSSIWGKGDRKPRAQDGGAPGDAYRQDEATTTGEAVDQIFCRVCGDCHFGPWGWNDTLQVLACDSCEDAFGLLAELKRGSRRLRLWTLVGDLSSDFVASYTEVPDEHSGACHVCAEPLVACVPHNVCKRRGETVYRCCLRCSQIARYLVGLGALKLELVKAYARIEAANDQAPDR